MHPRAHGLKNQSCCNLYVLILDISYVETRYIRCNVSIDPTMIPKSLVAASATPILLSILSHGDAYGYQIIQRIQWLSDGKMRWTPGTLYPVLHRMETRGLVEAYWQKADTGRKRKYYRITPLGQEALNTEKQRWLDVHAILERLWSPDMAWE